jgi:hypothetical protein
VAFIKHKQSPVPQGPVLRAQTEQGEQYDDPSEDLLFLLFEDLQQNQDYFIVERVADTTGQTCMQGHARGSGLRSGAPKGFGRHPGTSVNP